MKSILLAFWMSLFLAAGMLEASSPSNSTCSCTNCVCTPLNHCGCGGYHAKLVLGKATRKVAAKVKSSVCPACDKDNCDCGCGGDPSRCFCGSLSYREAMQQAFKINKPVAVFVNCKPKAIPNVISCYERSLEGNSTPRVEFACRLGRGWSFFPTPPQRRQPPSRSTPVGRTTKRHGGSERKRLGVFRTPPFRFQPSQLCRSSLRLCSVILLP